jgi:D-alanyl-D-alanine dipeptidase/CubicO group peptidase (beta-lactamase class C family)
MRLVGAGLILFGCALGAQTPSAPFDDALAPIVMHEMATNGIPAVAVAVVAKGSPIWSRDFGLARPADSVPADAATMYRVGSISMVFTDLALMNLVDGGQADLDAPVTRYLPTFQPHNPFGAAITLRRLMGHRSGLVREPVRGSVFDSTSPPLAEVVASLNATTVVSEPGSSEKYSDAGVSVVGEVIERMGHAPFAEYLQRNILDPMGLATCSFHAAPKTLAHLASGTMHAADGLVATAPTFALGTVPAMGLYCTPRALARVVRTLATSSTAVPEFATDTLAGHQVLMRTATLYGFTALMAYLPDDTVSVVVVANLDPATASVERIARAALEAALGGGGEGGRASAASRPPPAAPTTKGRQRGGKVATTAPPPSAASTEAPPAAPAATVNISPAVADTTPPPDVPQPWRGLLGQYGWPYNTLYVYEQDGRLETLVEWHHSSPLIEVERNRFAFPDSALYADEHLQFVVDSSGRGVAASLSGIVLPRRPDPAGQYFRITPVRPIAELRALALAASPPAESGQFRPSDLVDIAPLDSTIHIDIRYATTRNMLRTPVYTSARALMQRPAAEALARASQALAAQGYGLLVYDAYRPWYVTKIFWDATPSSGKIFVANPAQGSRHNRGCAVDLTLYELSTGKTVDMGGLYDEMTERSFPFYPGGTSLERWHRAVLRHAMEAQGFSVYTTEWWHFDYKDWPSYAIGNVPFEQIPAAAH